MEKERMEKEFKVMVGNEFEAWRSCELRQQVNNRSIEAVTDRLGDLAQKIKSSNGDLNKEDITLELGLCGGVLIALQGNGASLLDDQRKVLTNLSGLFSCIESDIEA